MARRDLHGCRSIVTGASSGIGKHLALQLANAGAHLILTARREKRLGELVKQITSEGGLAHAVAGDVTDAEVRQRCVEMAVEQFDGLDALVNNAGVGAYGPFADADGDRLRRIMEVNFFAPVELTRAALEQLKKGNRPIVVNIGSILGHRAGVFNSEYCASKFALHGISDALRAELSRDGVDVLHICPSLTASEFADSVLDRGDRTPKFVGKAMPPHLVARKTIRQCDRASRRSCSVSAVKCSFGSIEFAHRWATG
jgi:short-subunit dehydrogenase